MAANLTLKWTGGAGDSDDNGDLSARNWATSRPPSGAAGKGGISGCGEGAVAAAASRSSCARCSAGVKSGPGLPSNPGIAVTGLGGDAAVVIFAAAAQSTCGGGTCVAKRGTGCGNGESSVRLVQLLLSNPCPDSADTDDTVVDEEETVLLESKAELVPGSSLLLLLLLPLQITSGRGGISGTWAKSGSLSELES